MRLRLPALCAIGILLSGCAAGMRRATADGGASHRRFTRAEIPDSLRCDLRSCVLAEPTASFTGIIANGHRKVFASVETTTDMRGGKACDIGFRFKSLAWADISDVVSAYTGEVLLHIEATFPDAARIACRMLDPREPLGQKFAAQRLAADPRAPAVAVSRERDAAPAPTLPPPLMPRFQSAERPDDFAVVVGVENYPDLPRAAYAERDAAAVKAHLRALGVPERNIAFLAGQRASKSAIEKNVETWLSRMVKPDSRVYFYFSGHGAPDARTGQAYLVPIDGDPNFLENTGYPVKRLYERLGMLPAKQVLVAMDSCFSGAGGRSVLASGARPLLTHIDTGSLPRNVTAMTASASTEISGSLDEKGYGAFTYFFLEGLNGAAQDAAGRITAKSLSGYLTPRVQDEARRLNRDQTPQLLGADTGLLLR